MHKLTIEVYFIESEDWPTGETPSHVRDESVNAVRDIIRNAGYDLVRIGYGVTDRRIS